MVVSIPHIEDSDDHGSMYGVVDSLDHLTRALEQLLRRLPKEFMWPTIVEASPFSAYAEWGRDSTTEALGEDEPAVWLVASPFGVRMNASFRPGWPDGEAPDFNAEIAAEWLKTLTKYWKWQINVVDGRISAQWNKGDLPNGFAVGRKSNS